MLQPHAAIHPQTVVRAISTNGITIREDVAFTNAKGEDSKGARKRAEKALKKVGGILRQVLEPDEVVLYVFQCHRPVSVLEQMFLGWAVYAAIRVTVVITNRRLIRFSVKPDGTWKGSLRTLAWGDLESFKVKGWINRQLELKYRKGAKEAYWSIRGDDGKKLKAILPVVLADSQAETTRALGPVSLCPQCRATLTEGVYQCFGCRMPFRDEKTLLWRTIFIPGGAYFYTKNALLAFLTLVGESFALLVLAVLLAQAAGVLPLQPTQDDPNPTRAAAGMGALILFLLYAFETLIAYLHARRFVREFIPVNALPPPAEETLARGAGGIIGR